MEDFNGASKSQVRVPDAQRRGVDLGESGLDENRAWLENDLKGKSPDTPLIDLDTKISIDDFPKIEAEMAKIVAENRLMTRYEMGRDEGFKKIEAVLGCQIVLAQDFSKLLRFRRSLAFAEERTAHLGEQCKLFCGRRLGVIGYIVGRSCKSIEGENNRAMLFADQKRRDGKILASVILAGGK